MLINSFFLDYKGGNGIMGRCFVEVYDSKSVVLTEMTNNPGPSVTNACEQIVATIMNENLLGPTDFRSINWIEHYPRADSSEESYDLITFANVRAITDMQGNVTSDLEVSGPSWRRLDKSEVNELLGVDSDNSSVS